MRILILILFSTMLFGDCYTAFNGYASTPATEAVLLNGQKELLKAIYGVHIYAKKRANLEIETVKLNREIMYIRKLNLEKLKQIEFYLRKNHV